MSLHDLARNATPGPWERGDIWSVCGVMPERYGEGKCIHCVNVGTEPVWIGRTDINGKIMLAHRHRVSDPCAPDHLISGANGDLVCGNYDYDAGGVIDSTDARLIALCPEIAELLCDAMRWVESVRDEALVDREPDYVQMDSLLARFAEINNKAGQ